jgi:glycosyltransferase involved in cell wall biosynthesis
MRMPELRVGIDTSPLALTRAGTARYLEALLEQLERDNDLELRRYHFGGRSRPGKIARDVGWYLAALPLLARRDDADVLHCPTFRAPLRSPLPLVVTVHDLALLRHPEAFNRWARSYGRLTLPQVARTAADVIAVSEFTKGEVVELLGVAPERVHVVRHGVAPPFEAAGPAEDGDYVLAVSTLEPRKNLARLLDGFRCGGLDGTELRIAGARGWGGVRVEAEGARWLGEVADEELARLYRGARCLAYVSLYEGFGLPILEAMACGTPVVTTAWGACAEVAGDAAVLVDALDPDAIGAGLAEALGRREELVAKGLERAREFSWEKAARETADVYRRAAA